MTAAAENIQEICRVLIQEPPHTHDAAIKEILSSQIDSTHALQKAHIRALLIEAALDLGIYLRESGEGMQYLPQAIPQSAEADWEQAQYALSIQMGIRTIYQQEVLNYLLSEAQELLSQSEENAILFSQSQKTPHTPIDAAVFQSRFGVPFETMTQSPAFEMRLAAIGLKVHVFQHHGVDGFVIEKLS